MIAFPLLPTNLWTENRLYRLGVDHLSDCGAETQTMDNLVNDRSLFIFPQGIAGLYGAS